MYRAFREEVPEEEETFPIGKSRIALEGTDITLITYGASLRTVLEAATELNEQDGVSCEVIDLLSLSPLDDQLFIESVKKTGRAVVVHEAQSTYGAGAEVIARIVEKALLYLEAPVRRGNRFRYCHTVISTRAGLFARCAQDQKGGSRNPGILKK